jgi:hypothetical protein
MTPLHAIPLVCRARPGILTYCDRPDDESPTRAGELSTERAGLYTIPGRRPREFGIILRKFSLNELLESMVTGEPQERLQSRKGDALSMWHKLSLCLLLVLLAAPASSLTITESASYSTSARVFSGQSAFVTAPQSLPKFDPSLGVLTQVTLEINQSASAIGFVFGICQFASCSLFMSGQISHDYALSILGLSGAAQSASDDFTCFGVAGGACGGGRNINPASFSDTFVLSSSAALAAFSGPGAFTLTPGLGVQAGSLFVSGSVSSISGDVDGSLSGTVSVTYQYVPEPSTLVYLTVGLLGLSRWRQEHLEQRPPGQGSGVDT